MNVTAAVDFDAGVLSPCLRETGGMSRSIAFICCAYGDLFDEIEAFGGEKPGFFENSERPIYSGLTRNQCCAAIARNWAAIDRALLGMAPANISEDKDTLFEETVHRDVLFYYYDLFPGFFSDTEVAMSEFLWDDDVEFAEPSGPTVMESDNYRFYMDSARDPSDVADGYLRPFGAEFKRRIESILILGHPCALPNCGATSRDLSSDGPGYVYAIGKPGAVKLGQTSRDPVCRLKNLQTASDEKLELLACAKVDFRRKAEKDLHAMFRQQHKCREWFSITKEHAIVAVHGLGKAA